MFFSVSLNAVIFFLILILLISIALVLCINRFKQSSNGIMTEKNSAYSVVTIPPINKTSELPEYVNIQPVPMISTGISGETFHSNSPNCPAQPLGPNSTYLRANLPSAAEKIRKLSLLKTSKDFFSFKKHASFRTGRASLQTSPTRATFTDSLILVENASIQQLYQCNDSIKGVPTKQIRRYTSDTRCQLETPSRGRSHSADVEHSVFKKLKKPATYVNIDDWKQEIQDKVTLPIQSCKHQDICTSHFPPCAHMSLDDLCDIPTPKHQQKKRSTMDYNCSTISSSQPTHHEFVNSILLLSRESSPDTVTLSPTHKVINDLELSSTSVHMEKHEYVNLHPSTSINTPFSQELFSAFDTMIFSDDDLLKQSMDFDDENKTQTLENTSHVSNGDSHVQEFSSLKQNEVHHLRDQLASSENKSEKHDYINFTFLPPPQFDIPNVSPFKPSFAADTLSKSSQHHESLMDLDIADKNNHREHTANTTFCDISIKIEEHVRNTSTNDIYTEEATEERTVTIKSSPTSSKERVDSGDKNKTQDPEHRSHVSNGDSHDQEKQLSLKQNEDRHLRDQLASSENSSEKHDYINLTFLPPPQFHIPNVSPFKPPFAADTLSKSSRHHESLMDFDIADKVHDHKYTSSTTFCHISFEIEERTPNTSTNDTYTEEATEESTLTIKPSPTSNKERVDSDDENKTQDPECGSHVSSGDPHDQEELSFLNQNEAHHLRYQYLSEQFASSENSSKKHDYVNLTCLSPSRFDASTVNPDDLCLAADTLPKLSQHYDSLMDLDIADKNEHREHTANTTFCDISIKIEEHVQNTSTNDIYTEEATEERTLTINFSPTSSKERVDSDDENKTQDPEYRSHVSNGDPHDQEKRLSLKQNEDHHLRDQFLSSENSSEKHDYINLTFLPPSQFDIPIVCPVEPSLAANTISMSSQHQIYKKQATEESTVTISSSPTSCKEGALDTKICFDQEYFNKNQAPLLPPSYDVTTTHECSDGSGHIMKALHSL